MPVSNNKNNRNNRNDEVVDDDATTVRVSHVSHPVRVSHYMPDGGGMIGEPFNTTDIDAGSKVLQFEAAFENESSGAGHGGGLLDITEDSQFQTDTHQNHKRKDSDADADSILDDLEAFAAASPYSTVVVSPSTLANASTSPPATATPPTSPSIMTPSIEFQLVTPERLLQQQQHISHPPNIEEATTDDSEDEEPTNGSNESLEEPEPNERYLQLSGIGLVEALPYQQETPGAAHGFSAKNADPVFMVGGLNKGETESVSLLSKKKNKKMVFLLGLAVAILVLIGIVLGLVFGTKKNEGANNDSASSSSSSPNYNPEVPTASTPTISLEDSLPDYSQVSFEDPNSPQSQALTWLLKHPNVTSADSMPGWRQKQLFALATFFYSFGGPDWSTPADAVDWLDYDRSECDWYSSPSVGFDPLGGYIASSDGDEDDAAPCNSNGQYESLVLSGLELHPNTTISMPHEMALLTRLKTIELYDNNFPTNSSLLDVMPPPQWVMRLQTFIIANEPSLSGPVPTELNVWPMRLRDLVLVGTSLSGPIPEALGSMELQTLYLANNMLSGAIPASLFIKWAGRTDGSGHHPLQYLSLARNSFSAAIPTQIGLMTSLQELDLSANPLLSGSIPEELGALMVLPGDDTAIDDITNAYTGLRFLNLGGNDGLTGQVPRNLCDLNRETTATGAVCSYSAPLWINSDELPRTCALDFDCTHLLCGCNCICAL